MSERNTNDNEGQRLGPDPFGQAALLLVESLMHGLLLRSVISVEDAVEIVAVAKDVKRAVADEWGDTPDQLEKSLQLLQTISDSLSRDLPSPALDS